MSDQQETKFVGHPKPEFYYNIEKIGPVDPSVVLPPVVNNKHTVDFWNAYIAKYGIDGFAIQNGPAGANYVNIRATKFEKSVDLRITTGAFIMSRIGKIKPPKKGDKAKAITGGNILLYKDKQVVSVGSTTKPLESGLSLFTLLQKLSCILYTLMRARFAHLDGKKYKVPYSPYSTAASDKVEDIRKPHLNPFSTISFELELAPRQINNGPRAGTTFDPNTKITQLIFQQGKWVADKSAKRIMVDSIETSITELSMATEAVIDMSYLSTEPDNLSIKAKLVSLAYVRNPKPPTMEVEDIDADSDIYSLLSGFATYAAPPVDPAVQQAAAMYSAADPNNSHYEEPTTESQLTDAMATL